MDIQDHMYLRNGAKAGTICCCGEHLDRHRFRSGWDKVTGKRGMPDEKTGYTFATDQELRELIATIPNDSNRIRAYRLFNAAIDRENKFGRYWKKQADDAEYGQYNAEKELEQFSKILKEGIEFIEGLQGMQAMPSKEFDEAVDKYLRKNKELLKRFG